MAGYAIIHNAVTDESLYAEFREQAAATIEQYGGKYLVRGGAAEAVDGDWVPDRVVVVEFASVAQAKAWFNSPEFAEAKQVRAKCADAIVVIVEGV
ncbi:MAG: DUF1330 domain-containing protein [Chloroflexota bacterium]|nr:DUF1330 domain-containing protein [Chloroflexota bacterium]MDE2839993.1 DUF1330 domain-containing protein [Chloroflexota bacterium]MDE2931090.1 DUF1330 domain-containing protein [Chloroflexota bacterium]